MAKIPTIVSVILAGLLVASILPPLSNPQIECIVLLMAGGVVIYRDMSSLRKTKTAGRGPRAAGIPQPVHAPWTHSGVEHWRRR
jgi:hypothetical protein